MSKEYVYLNSSAVIYRQQLWVCPTCLAVTFRHDQFDHAEWHRTLTNRPREEGT